MADPPHGAKKLIGWFDNRPTAFPWREPRPREIETRRAQMADQLLFDVLLSSGGIKDVDSLYPPTDLQGLERLLDAIDDSSYDTLKKDCLVYYLLKWHQDGRETKLATERSIPPQFTLLADAYWHLDSGINIPHAVSILSEARLNRDYSSKIIQAISLSNDASRLILKYIRTAKPSLTEPDDLDIYVTALAENSILEAWQYQRTFCEKSETRQRLVRKILDWCLSPKPRQRPLAQLISFCFTPYEQNLINTYALSPPSSCPPSSIPIIHDFVIVHLIQSSQYASAVKMDKRFAASALSTRANVQKAVQDRRKMIEDILSALPSVELSLLQNELNMISKGTGMPSTSTSEDMSVDVPPPPPPTTNGQPLDPSDNPFTPVPDTQNGNPAEALQNSGLFPSKALRPRPSVPEGSPEPQLPLLPPPPGPAYIPIIPVTSSYGISGGGSPFGTSSSRKSLGASTGPSANRSLFGGPRNVPSAGGKNLFGSVNGKANAFFEPAKHGPINGTVRNPSPPLPQSSQPPLEADDDVMDTDDEIVNRVPPRRGVDISPPQPELGFSVFSNNNRLDPSTVPAASAKSPPRRTSRMEVDTSPTGARGRRSTTAMPPGAFVEDEGSAREPSPPPQRISTRASTRKREAVSPISPHREHKRHSPARRVNTTHHPKDTAVANSGTTAKGKQRQQQKKQNLGRSLPGRFHASDEDEDDDDGLDAPEEREEDVVPPLPTITSTSPKTGRRGGRHSAASSRAGTEEPAPRVRRSTRLSGIQQTSSESVVDSLSAAPVTRPKAPRKSTKGTKRKA